jgi:phosphate transport system protein
MSHLDEQIRILKDDLAKMWTLVNSQMEKARLALLNFDKTLALDVSANEKRVDAFELKMDLDSETLFLLQNPFGTDARFIIAVLKINYNLERIGDYANGIARTVKACDHKYSDEVIDNLHVMELFFIAQDMLSKGLLAFENDDKTLALNLFRKDKQLDKMYLFTEKAAVDLGRKNPEILQDVIDVLSISRRLERAGDHLKNIAEEFIFYLDAEILKHSKHQKKAQN